MCNRVFGSVGGFTQPRYQSIDWLYHVVSYSFNSILTNESNAYTLLISVTLHLLYYFHSCQVYLLIPHTFDCLFSVFSSRSPQEKLSDRHPCMKGNYAFRGCQMKGRCPFLFK